MQKIKHRDTESRGAEPQSNSKDEAFRISIFGFRIYSRSKTRSFGPGQSLMALPVRIAGCFGVLDYWSVGKSESAEFQLELVLSLLHYSPTPPLQQTAARGERPLKPPQGAAQSRVLWARILYLKTLPERLASFLVKAVKIPKIG